ncbi:aspartate carbamoyltransferase regulatory subunit [Methanococcus voltae]|uniref:Aspartate carbamoyltransferase regulatory chain n=1 Tax=Methanococcus voltae (strain ATCC BAA-1334 / A3) TaxID=456320 RepID=D7DSZ9_METV3|nr:aspartate carbamoyltransferase regulatory subunit [Methanococcus voltae]MCS3901965.1 aspartate carbamoyltransferase regulatory subunit [Methanococcus voltae]
MVAEIDKKQLKVKPIENGTVIDHIECSKALNVYQILNMPKDTTLTLAMNVNSKNGAKDILKIEGKELCESEVSKIALISPNATINIIKDSKVLKKFKVQVPDEIEGILICTNPNCITNKEKVNGKFTIEDKEKLKIRCNYCEKFINEIKIKKE